jgi:hypothetical protein
MERRSYRSTSLVHLLAEIHQQELLAEAERRRRPVRAAAAAPSSACRFPDAVSAPDPRAGSP